jgi:hypothetical protein
MRIFICPNPAAIAAHVEAMNKSAALTTVPRLPPLIALINSRNAMREPVKLSAERGSSV